MNKKKIEANVRKESKKTNDTFQTKKKRHVHKIGKEKHMSWHFKCELKEVIKSVRAIYKQCKPEFKKK